MEELKNFNIHDLFRLIGKPDDEFLQWLKDKNWFGHHAIVNVIKK